MSKILKIIWGLGYILSALGPVICKWYREGITVMAVIQAELEDLFGDKPIKKGEKKQFAINRLKKSIFSTLKKESDNYLGMVVQEGWNTVFNKKEGK
jgi:hypothetical protein